MRQIHNIGESPAFSNPPVPKAARSNWGLTSARNSRRWLNAFTMAGVTWLGGSGYHFRRFDQIRQPNGAGIGTRKSGTVHTHQRVRYASKA
jgi:hypothetical protein